MARPNYPSDFRDKIMLRFPDGMKDLLAKRASENRRSINSEIVAILESTLLPAGNLQSGEQKPFDVVHAGLVELLAVVQQHRERKDDV